jgi:osmotically-inducible protein OsmY
MGRYGEEGWQGGGSQGRWGGQQGGNYRMDRDAGQSRGGFEGQGSGRPFVGESSQGGGRSSGSYGNTGFGRGGSGSSGGSFGQQQGGRGFWDKASDEVSSWMGDDDARRRREQDEHRGRGPKGYTRSDERIREDVNDRLTDDGLLDASDIEVQVASSEVTLTGQVKSREEKRRAEDIVEAVSGVRHVQNNLRVQDRNASPGQASATEFGSSAGGSTSSGSGSRSSTR